MPEGSVVAYSGEYIFVRLADGSEALVRRRGRAELDERQRRRRAAAHHQPEQLVTQKVVVGDRVRLAQPESGGYIIEEMLERETWLIRKTQGRYARRPQCVVANADQLAVMVAPNPVIRPSAIDRCFLAAIQGGLRPLLVVNKIDLDPALPADITLRNYRELGYRVFFTQATTGEGLDDLAAVLTGQSTAFCGHSGVGKSTILSRLTGVPITVGAVRERDQKGRQTTTAARLYQLPGGGDVIDTPGIREFGLIHLTWLDVHDYFTDVAAWAAACDFRDCTHTSEPGCAVLAAVAAGQLSRLRLESYCRLRAEAESFKHWA